MPAFIPVPRPNTVPRGLRTAIGSGVNVIGPGAQIFGGRARGTADPTLNDPTGPVPDGLITFVGEYGAGGGTQTSWQPPALCDTSVEINHNPMPLETQIGPKQIVEIQGPSIECGLFSLADRLDKATEMTREALIARFWWQIASQIWYGPSLAVQTLVDNPVNVAGTVGYEGGWAIGTLEQLAAGSLGPERQLLIHIPYSAVPDFVGEGWIQQVAGSNRFVTANGNVVVADPAYGMRPAPGDDPVPPTAPELRGYITATLPINVWIGEPYQVGGENGGISYGTNDAEVMWRVPVAWGWETFMDGDDSMDPVMAFFDASGVWTAPPEPEPEPDPEPEPEP